MECVQITESRILAEEKLAELEKKSERWKQRLASQLESDIGRLKSGKKASKHSDAERTYRMTKTLAEVELPRLNSDVPVVYSVTPGEGEELSEALVAALTELRDALVAGRLDGVLLTGPQQPESGCGSPPQHTSLEATSSGPERGNS